jgi:UDP-N-acetylglucosamine:LPS N-acetylglucosamine transferase
MLTKNRILCVVCSAGGHLTEALLAVDDVDYPKYFVTYKLPHTDQTLSKYAYYYIINPHKNMFKYPVNFLQSLKIYFQKRPAFILSTGSGMTIATCLIGKLFGSKIIYIETGARIYIPSMTGRLLYYFSDLFIVQWKPLLTFFPKGVYGGLLF